MQTTIVYAHPWDGSLNHGILERVTGALHTVGRDFEVIDLNADGFNPVLTREELALFARGEATDPLVHKYMDILRRTDEIVFIFPVWWYGMPAILHGFFDKVMLNGFGYRQTPTAMEPLLSIGRSTVITTSQIPTDVLKEHFGDPIGGVVINGILHSVGITGGAWLNCDQVKFKTPAQREEFLQQVEARFSR